MPNIRIITPNESDTAALSANPAVVATLPVTNLQEQARERVMRTTSVAGQEVKGTWSASKWISACALMRHNLSVEATWRLRLYSDAAWSTQVYDSGALPAIPAKTLGDLDWGIDELGASLFTGWPLKFSPMYFAATVARSFTLTLTDTAANTDGYMEASRLYIGRYLEPLYNFEWGIRMGWQEDTAQERTDGGTLRSDGVDPYRTMSFRLDLLSPSDRPKFQEWSRRDGRRNDVFISAYPGAGGALERDHAMSAKLVVSPDLAHRHVNEFGGEYVIEEA